jgi:hypothetical protein
MNLRALFLAVILACCLPSLLSFGGSRDDMQALLTGNIPPRPAGGMSGSEFARSINGLQGTDREQMIVDQFKAGNLPDFLRRLASVHLSRTSGDGRTTTVTLFVMPDYLSIGSNQDFIRIPMGLHAATAIADQFGFTLPTRKIVDAIFSQSAVTLKPEPLPAGDQMRSTAYYLTHNRMIQEQRLALGCPLGELISGHKKDVVMSNRLTSRPGKVAIYGWHRPTGVPIQPLSTVHGSGYADYSHGIRLISTTALLDGHPCSIWAILEDPALAGVLSDEGAVREAWRLTALGHRQPIGESLDPSEAPRF